MGRSVACRDMYRAGVLFCAGVLALSPGLASAQSGSWNVTTGGSWGTSSNWASGTIASGTGNTATFGLSFSGTNIVTLDGARTIGNITFNPVVNTGIWAIATGSGGPLTLAVTTGTPTIDVSASKFAGISAIVSGTQGLAKSGAGQLILQGANTYTGVTTVNAGTLRVENGAGLGASGAGNHTVVVSGARVQIANSGTIAESFSIAGAGTTGAINNGLGSNTITGAVTLTAAATIGSGTNSKLILDRQGAGNAIDNGGFVSTFTGTGEVEVASPIVGAGGLTKAGAGTLTLTGSNTYAGTTTITGGALNVRNSSGLGGAGAVSLTAGSLQLQGGIAIGAKPLSIQGVGLDSSGALRNISGDNSYAGLITISSTATARINSDAGSLTLSGGVTGDGSSTLLIIGGAGDTFVSGAVTTGTAGLTKQGTGVLTLAGANTYSGATNIADGSLRLGNGGTGGSMNTASSINMQPGTTFIVAQSDTVTQGTDFTGGALTGQGGFTQAGSGTTILTAANEYKGQTSVLAGTLLINGNHTFNAPGAVSVSSGATLGGTGVVGGALTVAGGGSLAPGAGGIGTLSMASTSVTLNPASILNFELFAGSTTAGGGVNDLIAGVNGLTLDGVLNVSGSGDWTSVPYQASWRLFDYTGALTNNTLTLGSMPTLAAGYSFLIDTSTPGQVNLVAVPEPSTAALLAASVVGVGLFVRRRHRAAQPRSGGP